MHRPPAPEKNPAGAPIEIAGSVWYLPSLGFSAGWATTRDRIYDESLLGGQVFSADVDECAFAMFLMNYDQPAGEILELIRRADRKELVGIVTGNALNLDLAPEHRTFTYYARTALRAAGIDPDKVPPEECAGVLAHLVGTGRALSHEKFTKAGEFADVKAELLGLVR